MSFTVTLAGPTQASLNGLFTFIDTTNIQAPLSKVIPTLVANLSAAIFGEGAIGTSSTPVTLPINPTQLFYARNLSLSATITITWTPVGASSAEILVIQPGGMLFFFNPGSGISALSVVASAAGTIVDYILAG
jgi:hypothetical protein